VLYQLVEVRNTMPGKLEGLLVHSKGERGLCCFSPVEVKALETDWNLPIAAVAWSKATT
jgi:hypothetical protein